MKKESGSMVTYSWVDTGVKLLKFLAYVVTFAAVLGSAVISKGTLLFITSQLKKGRHISHCNKALGKFNSRVHIKYSDLHSLMDETRTKSFN